MVVCGRASLAGQMSLLKKVFGIVADQLPAAGVECVLIGGFAVNYYGYSRNTLDVDFMILSDQVGAVRSVMAQAGFINISVCENVVFFGVPGSSLRVDFLRSDSETMSKLLDGACLVGVQGHQVKIPALRDLIAMKVFSLSQAPARRMAKDLPDIAYLSVLNGLDLETDLKPLCEKFGDAKTYDLIRGQIQELKIP
jgi:hypothetical protein